MKILGTLIATPYINVNATEQEDVKKQRCKCMDLSMLIVILIKKFFSFVLSFSTTITKMGDNTHDLNGGSTSQLLFELSSLW